MQYQSKREGGFTVALGLSSVAEFNVSPWTISRARRRMIMCSPDNPDLGKAEHFGQRASAFLRPVIGSCSTNRNQQYWNLIGEKAEFTRDGHRIEADHRGRAQPMHFGGI